MYTRINFRTKKELKHAVEVGQAVFVLEPGIQTGQQDGYITLEGPHFPKAHSWYAEAEIKDGRVVRGSVK